MTEKEEIEEINKVFEPAFANYIITALTEGATVSDRVSEQESKTGHWEDGDKTRWKCSNCGYGVLDWNTTPYCPNCVVKMESEEK